MKYLRYYNNRPGADVLANLPKPNVHYIHSERHVGYGHKKESPKNTIKYSAKGVDASGLVITYDNWSWGVVRKPEWDMVQDGVQYYAYADMEGLWNIEWAYFFTEEYTDLNETNLTYYYYDGESIAESDDVIVKYLPKCGGGVMYVGTKLGESEVITVNNSEMYRKSEWDRIENGVNFYAFADPNNINDIYSAGFIDMEAYLNIKDNGEDNIGWFTLETEGEEEFLSGVSKTIKYNGICNIFDYKPLYLVAGDNNVIEYEGVCESISASENNLISNIEIPNSVIDIPKCAFQNCTGMTSVTIPDSVENIGEQAFGGCFFTDSNFVNNSECEDSSNWGATIYEDATESDGLIIDEYNCLIKARTYITSITISNSVTSIGEWAFNDCMGLTEITYEGTKEQWNNIDKGENWNSNTSLDVVHCTDGDLSFIWLKAENNCYLQAAMRKLYEADLISSPNKITTAERETLQADYIKINHTPAVDGDTIMYVDDKTTGYVYLYRGETSDSNDIYQNAVWQSKQIYTTSGGAYSILNNQYTLGGDPSDLCRLVLNVSPNI